MIRFVSPELEKDLQTFCNTKGVFHSKIYNQYQVYGAQSGMVDFWLVWGDGQRPCAAISRQGRELTVAGGAGCDPQELAAFLPMAGRSAEGELGALLGLNAVIHGELCSSWILREQRAALGRAAAPAAALCAHGVPVLRPAACLSEVYDLLSAADPAFAATAQYDAWLAETSHKLRHQLAEIYTLSVSGVIVSTMGIYFQNNRTALLAGLATHPAHTKKGYGRRILLHTAQAARGKGLTPYLLAAQDHLLPFYRLCGFAPAGRWGRLSFPAPAQTAQQNGTGRL